LIEDRRGEPDSEWDTDEDRWLREVIERTEGADGLAELARVSKRANDLRAWCHALTAANDWEAAFAAYKEAADTVATNALARAGFLDGVALAAQLLERNDLHHHLERAWREMPTLLRLRRWLGSAKSGAVLRKRAQQALEGCSKKAARQLGLLHIVLGDLKSAAALLADAPGLGWSDTDHPGHLLFPLFQQLLGGVERPIPGEFELSLQANGTSTSSTGWRTNRTSHSSIRLGSTRSCSRVPSTTP
jgi:hypothetical protein